jgi:hypothetical protein
VTTFAPGGTYSASGGLWVRKGHASIDPGGGGSGSSYDWTANPYGSVYDARPSGVAVAGGYVPDLTANTVGIPTGITPSTTIPGSSGFLTLNGAATSLGACTISAATNKVIRNAHGLTNGTPVWFPSLTGGAGLAVFSVKPHENWYVVDNATSDDFTLKKADPLTGAFSAVDVTADYTSATLYRGTWYDQVDFTCNIKSSSSANGVCLITRSKIRGPATAVTSSGLVWNGATTSGTFVFIVVDSKITPDDPNAELDGSYGPNFWGMRNYYSHCSDGHGSWGGGVHLFGNVFEKSGWHHPNPNHADGDHNDVCIQIATGDGHVVVGNVVDAAIDSAASDTDNSTTWPIPTFANSAIIINAGSPIPSSIYIAGNDLRRGQTTLNIAPNPFPSIQVLRNRFHRNDSSKPNFGATRVVVTPNVAPGSATTIHASFPSSGADVNTDETGATMTPNSTGSTGIYAAGLGGNTTITYP